MTTFPSSNQPPAEEPWLSRLPKVLGRRVLGSVILLDRLGAGAMGIVFRAWHIDHGFEVAVKILNPMLAVDAVYVTRFRREAKLAMSITHHNVVRVFDVRCDASLHYIVMEYVAGETLSKRVARRGALSVDESAALIAGLAAGLAEAHALGIVHRDIKPDNVMIATSGRAKLADLGLARQVLDESGTTLIGQTALVMGTPQYMSPEQWETPNVKPPCDVWALGATMHFAVTGRAAVPAGAPGPVARWIYENELPALRGNDAAMPPQLVAIYERCVHRAPEQRYVDACALLRELEQIHIPDESCLADPSCGERAGSDLPGAAERLALRRWLASVREAGHAPQARTQKARTQKARTQQVRRSVMSPVWGIGALSALLLVVLVPNLLTTFGRAEARTAASYPSVLGLPLVAARRAFESGEDAQALAMLAAADERAIARDEVRAIRDLRRRLVERRQQQMVAELRAQFVCDALAGDATSRVSAVERRLPAGPATLAQRELTVALQEWPETWESLRFELHAMPAATSAQVDAASSVELRRAECARLFVDADGTYALRAVVEDSIGVRQSVALGTVCMDTRSPLVRSVAPTSGAVVGRGAELVVLCDEVVALVRVRAAGAWLTAIPMSAGKWQCRGVWSNAPIGSHGPATVRVEATDAAGNVGCCSVTVIVDDAAPVLSGTHVPAVTSASTLDLHGWAVGATEAVLEACSPDGAQRLRTDVDASGAFCFAIPMLSDGTFRGSVFAVDDVGNASTTVSFSTLRLCQAPRIDLLAPTNMMVGNGTVTFVGRVVHGLPVASLLCNERQIEVAADGTWSCSVPVAGELRVAWIVTDVAGNRSELVRWCNRSFAGLVLDVSAGVQMRPVVGGACEPTATSRYWMAATEVTRGQWQSLGFEPKRGWQREDLRLPADRITFAEARAFCARLTKIERRLGRVPRGYRYDLPSEQQWEQACRAGSSAAFYFGDCPRDLARHAVVDVKRCEPVGRRRANALSLFDMHGNVEEWCISALADNREGDQGWAVVRGGSYVTLAEAARCDARQWLPGSSRQEGVGFRVALVCEGQ